MVAATDCNDVRLVDAEECIEQLRTQLADVTAERDNMSFFLEAEGYRRCDVPACNCGSWHGGHLMERLQEIDQALPEANGPTILQRITALRKEVDELRQRLSVEGDLLALGEAQHCPAKAHCIGCNSAELLAEEVECVHMHLDALGVPRVDGADNRNTYSAVGRIDWALARRLKDGV